MAGFPLDHASAGAASYSDLAFFCFLLTRGTVSDHTERYQQGHYLVCVTSHPVWDIAWDVEGTASRDATLDDGGLFSFSPSFWWTSCLWHAPRCEALSVPRALAGTFWLPTWAWFTRGRPLCWFKALTPTSFCSWQLSGLCVLPAPSTACCCVVLSLTWGLESALQATALEAFSFSRAPLFSSSFFPLFVSE